MLENRRDYYKVPVVESFMINILEKKNRIEPIFDLRLGYRYPEVEEKIKMDSVKTTDFLENLFELNILGREKYDMELRCPTCNSPNVSTNYVCPHCASSTIQRTILIEHRVCGYLGTLTSLGQPLVCPKCGTRIAEGDYRDAGSIYECASCKKQIDTPFTSHWCRECSFKFSFENAVYQPKYAYFPAELTRKEMDAGILYLSQVADVFKQQEFTRGTDTKVVGDSRSEHVFDMVFTDFGLKSYVDILFSLDPLSQADIIREYGKILDSKTDPYVIVLPGLNSEASALAKSYNMNVIEADKPGVALSKLQVDLATKVLALKASLTSKTEATEKQKNWATIVSEFFRRLFRRRQ